jgi:hypothetical protein
MVAVAQRMQAGCRHVQKCRVFWVNACIRMHMHADIRHAHFVHVAGAPFGTHCSSVSASLWRSAALRWLAP